MGGLRCVWRKTRVDMATDVSRRLWEPGSRNMGFGICTRGLLPFRTCANGYNAYAEERGAGEQASSAMLDLTHV